MRVVAKFVLVSTTMLLYDIVAAALPSTLNAASLPPASVSMTQNRAFSNNPAVMRFKSTFSVPSPLKTSNGQNAQTTVAKISSTAVQSSKTPAHDNGLNGLAAELVKGERAKGVEVPGFSKLDNFPKDMQARGDVDPEFSGTRTPVVHKKDKEEKGVKVQKISSKPLVHKEDKPAKGVKAREVSEPSTPDVHVKGKWAKRVKVPEVSEPSIQDVHNSVVLLLLHKMQRWMDGVTKNLDAINKYLGFPQKIINLINFAITKLHSAYRKGLIDIAKLLVAYYYSCDIEHMRSDHSVENNGNDDVATVTETFQIFLSSFGYTPVDLRNVDEVEIMVGLQKNVNGVRVPVSPAHTVTIDLMKNRMFKKSTTTKKSVKKLEERYANDIKSGEKMTDGIKVTENHLNVIGKLIPDIFGLAINHLELFAELKKYELDEQEETKAVRCFSGFLRSFMDVFMYRYLEFKGKLDDVDVEFLEAIYPLIDFMDPDKAPEAPEYSILNYRDHDNTKYEKHMRNLMDSALEKLLAVFGNENAEEWEKNRTLKVDYPRGELTKNILVELMNSNTNDSFDVLGTFVENFAQGIDLYSKHLYNISQWPTDDEFRPIDFILM